MLGRVLLDLMYKGMIMNCNYIKTHYSETHDLFIKLKMPYLKFLCRDLFCVFLL